MPFLKKLSAHTPPTIELCQTVADSYHHQLLPFYAQFDQVPPPCIYVACSGGRDSLVLLDSLCQLSHQLNVSLQVLHVNHRLQVSSDDWQQQVEVFCMARGLVCISLTLDWQADCVGQVNEQTARQARYQALANWLAAHHTAAAPPVLVLAHHADDHAETFLLNLCQGTGLRGLVGMRAVSVQHEFGLPLLLWRPLLAISRTMISAYADAKALPYVDDPTNVGKHNRRAWLRAQVLPLLKAEFGGWLDNITRTSANLADAEYIVNAQAEQDLAVCLLTGDAADWTPTQSRLDIAKIADLPLPRVRALLRLWLAYRQPYAPPQQVITQIVALLGLAEQSPLSAQSQIHWQGVTVRRYQMTLYRLDAHYASEHARWTDSTRAQAAVAAMLATLEPKPDFYPTFSLRRPHAGECFRRQGKSFHEPLKKLCQRLAIASWQRDLLWVIEHDRQARALWLPQRLIWLAA